MAPKTLIRLLVVVAALGGIAAILHFAGTGGGVSRVDPTTDKRKVFPDFPLNDVATVRIEDRGESVTLTKGEAAWEVVERDGYPADAEPVVELLRGIWDLNIVQPVTVGRTQYHRLGLAPPEEAGDDEAPAVLAFQDAEGRDLASLWLGRIYERSDHRPDPFGGGMATTEAGRYVKPGDSNAVYLVGETFSRVRPDPSDWIDKSFFRVQGIRSIAIDTGDPAQDWKLVREEEHGDYTLADAGEKETLDQTKVSSMKTAFSNPQMEDVLTGEAAEEAETGAATFRIATFDGFEYEISVGEKNDLNELPLTVKVSAEFQEEREEGEEESDEEKERLDAAFQERLDELKDKLAREQRLEGHIFKVRSFLVDPIKKPRADLLEVKGEDDEEGETDEIAPGVTLPGLPEAPSPAPEG